MVSGIRDPLPGSNVNGRYRDIGWYSLNPG
jgi:hypothetical protein